MEGAFIPAGPSGPDVQVSAADPGTGYPGCVGSLDIPSPSRHSAADLRRVLRAARVSHFWGNAAQTTAVGIPCVLFLPGRRRSNIHGR